MNIETCYELALDYFADALSDAERLQVERFLRDDDALARHYAHIQQALELAGEPPALDGWSPERAEGVWASIAQETDLEATSASSGPWLAAALVLVALGGILWLALGGSGDAPEAPPEVAQEVPQPKKVPPPAPLQARRAPGLQGPVFVTPEASWSYDDARHELRLERGRALVEFIPRPDGRTLTVRTPDAHVHVLGTVFSVEHREGATRVAVFEGKVEVTRGDARILVGKNERLGERASSPVLVTPAQREEVGRHIDLSAHTALLARAQARARRLARAQAKAETVAQTAPVARSPQPKKPGKKPVSVKVKLERAESLMKKGAHKEAYRALDALSSQVPPRSPRARSIHLDLARIAMRHLRDPALARAHLRVLATRWPDHPATAIVRQQLCALSSCD